MRWAVEGRGDCGLVDSKIYKGAREDALAPTPSYTQRSFLTPCLCVRIHIVVLGCCWLGWLAGIGRLGQVRLDWAGLG